MHMHIATRRIDEDEYGGLVPLLQEGTPPSIALFVVRTAYIIIAFPHNTCTARLDLDLFFAAPITTSM